MKIRLSAFVLLAGLLSVPARGLELLRDINTRATAGGSNAFNILQIGERLIFLASDPVHGQELWATDGTPGGTQLLADIMPGPESSSAGGFTLVGSKMFFWANDGTNGSEPWVTDGTREGTHIIADITPTGAISTAGFNIAWNGQLVFQYVCCGTAPQLWRSDGTPQGTTRFTNLQLTGAGGFDTVDMAIFGNRLYFVYSDGLTGQELWSTDGTAAGTGVVAEIAPGTAGSFPNNLQVVGNQLYFRADDGAHGLELWHIPQPGAQPVMVGDLEPGPADSNPSAGASIGLNGRLVYSAAPSNVPGLYGAAGGAIERLGPAPLYLLPAGDRAYFLSLNAATVEIWSTDGTRASTSFITAIQDLDPFIQVRDATVLGTQLMLTVLTAAGRNELWTSDGTAGGTHSVGLSSAIESTSPGDGALLVGDGAIYFSAKSVPAGQQQPIVESIWRTDGTQAGTMRILSDVTLVEQGAASMTFVDGQLFLAVNDPDVGGELFASDGSVGSLTLLRDVNEEVVTAGTRLLSGAILGSEYYFSAENEEFGRELWRTDGTPAGTRLAVDIVPGPQWSAPGVFTRLGSRLLFWATTDGRGAEPWTTDGTEQGTTLLTELAPGGESSDPGGCDDSISVIGDRAFIGGPRDALQNRPLFVTDGTIAGTGRFFAPGSANENLRVCFATSFQGVHYFFDGLNSLWRTDGTPAGTVKVFTASTTAWEPRYFTVSNGLLYFSAFDSGQPQRRQLWRTDGTEQGTVVVSNVDTEPKNITPLGSTTLFRAHCQGSDFCTLFKTDGTLVGTTSVTNLQPAGPSISRPMPVLNGRLFFLAVDTGSGLNGAIYSTDGSSVTTAFSLPAGQQNWFVPGEVIRDRLIGTGLSGPNRYALWRSDGTASGTTRIALFTKGQGVLAGRPLAFSVLGVITGVGQSLVFPADDGIHGDELWAIENSQPSANPDLVTVAATGPTSIDALANDGDLDDTLDPASVQITTPPTFGTATVNATTGAVTYTPGPGSVGADRLSYVVQDSAGNTSNAATVDIWVRRPAGQSPASPPVTPPPGGGGSGGGSGGGGGGAFSLLLLAVLTLVRAKSGYRHQQHIRTA